MTDTSTPTASATQALAGKYLTFVLGRESYGIQVVRIREIIRFTTITAVPQMPDYVRGVINLRGKIIPVIDLRTRFALGAAETTERTCIVVVQVEGEGGKCRTLGLTVDAVEEVVNVTVADVEETPDFGGTIEADYILGMAKIRGSVKTLLDVNRVVSSDALSSAHPEPVVA